ncbi:MAG: YceI family protein [Mariniblastus sp.]
MKKLIYLSFAMLIAGSTNIHAQDTAEKESKPAAKTADDARPEGGRRQRGQRGRRGGTQESKPVVIEFNDGTAALTPENTKIDFVGTHIVESGEDPNARLGGFKKFNGSLSLTEDGSSIKSLSMEFQIDSIWTEAGEKLTGHLLNEDFFDAKKYPTAKFESKSVAADEKEGTLNVVGDLTIMGKTNEITLPVAMKKTEAGVTAKSEFKLDRTSFGMGNMVDRVAKEVAINLSVGEKTTAGAAPAARGGRGAGGRGGWNPDVFFKQQDKNSDGKISMDEVESGMQDRLKRMDADGDESVSKKEFNEFFEKMRSERGQRGSGQRGGQRGGNGK